MYILIGIGLRWEEKNDVVKWNRADQIEEEERSQVMAGDLFRIKNDLIREVVRYDAYDNNWNNSNRIAYNNNSF